MKLRFSAVAGATVLAVLLGSTFAPVKAAAQELPTPTPTMTATATPTRTPTPSPLERVCKRIVPFGYHVLYKYQASGHLSGSDRARSCSLIYGPGATAPAANSLPLYDKKGNLLSVFRNYARNGYYKARFYTYSPACSQVAAKAKRVSRTAEGYIAIGNKMCLKVNNLYGRQGAAY